MDRRTGATGLRSVPGGRRRATAVLAIGAAGVALLGASPVASAAVNARILGPFTMTARVTAAENVRGERVGQRLVRHWTFFPVECSASVCGRLLVRRQRSAGRRDAVGLRRVGPGTYVGHGAFDVPLRCRHHVYKRGSRVTYRVAVKVARVVTVQAIRFATAVTATYTDVRRSNTTPCPYPTTHDAGTYRTLHAPPPPGPPTAAAQVGSVDRRTDVGTFADTSQPGPGGAAIVARAWDFGDPASGPANSSADPGPSHRFTRPGSYVVTLTVLDANGLSSTTSATVVAPAPTLLPFISP